MASDQADAGKESSDKKTELVEEAIPVLNESNVEAFLRDYKAEQGGRNFVIHTDFGDIRILLYENTPLHLANFQYLNSRAYFNDTWFYRVSKGHVIQAGNTDDRETVKTREAIGEYRIPSEISSGNRHKYGAIAAARSYKQNPEKASDPYEFYIVLGKSYSRRELELLAEKHELSFNSATLDFYENRRGAPHLDGEHTVFGEVIEGMDVVEKISQVEVDEGEWPLVNIPIRISAQ